MTLDKPYWLLTLIILPVIVGLSRHSLSALGTFRRKWVIALRCLIVLVLSIALAEPQFHHPRQHACVMVLADESASMPEFLRSQSLEIASRAIHERQNPSDMVGVVVFGSDARIEVPPASHGPAKEIHAVRASVDRQGSDIGRAIRMALATIPADANARLVLCSDGNQNRGNALAEAANARQLGIPIDVVPLDFERSAEVIVEKLLLPERVKLGEQLRIKVVLRSMSDARGLLTIRRLTADGMSPVVEERVSLRQGINAFTVETRVDDPESYRFEAEFTPSSSADDHFAQNNRAGSYTIIEGTPRVLLIESEAGAESRLVESLSAAKIASVSVVPEELKESLNYYRPFDAVILANVPASRMTEAVQRAIVNNTRTLGTGLLVIGGPRSFGPGGYADSPLEEAFPVECDVESTRIEPSLAMLFVIDRSGSMSGPKIQLALAAAKHSVEMLEPRVEAGVIAFDGEPAWVRRLLPVGDRSALLQRLDSIQVGGGTEMFSALKLALESLLSSKQMIRHVILLSDGQSIPGDWNSLVTKFRDAKITVTTVAVGSDSDRELMRRLATRTGGRFYFAAHPRALPKIYVRETRIVSRPQIFERDSLWLPKGNGSDEMLAGLSTPTMPLRGFVLTTPKRMSEVPLASPLPPELPVNPLLAHWQFGLGRSVAFTSDAGARWTAEWSPGGVHEKFWSQVVRWSLRTAETGELVASMAEEDGRVSVVVHAVDRDRQFIDGLQLTGTLLRPDSATEPLTFRETEPGRYLAEFDATIAGSYLVAAVGKRNDGRSYSVTAGMDSVHSPEFRDVTTNYGLLENIATISGGNVLSAKDLDVAELFHVFKTRQVGSEPGWPLLLFFCLVAFAIDVASRRLPLGIEDLKTAGNFVAQRVLRRAAVPGASAGESPPMGRLRAMKSEVNRSFEERRRLSGMDDIKDPLTARESLADSSEEARLKGEPLEPDPSPKKGSVPSEPEAESPMSRLLHAKKETRQQRGWRLDDDNEGHRSG